MESRKSMRSQRDRGGYQGIRSALACQANEAKNTLDVMLKKPGRLHIVDRA